MNLILRINVFKSQNVYVLLHLGLDPVLQNRNRDLESKDQYEDEHEADDGLYQILLRLLSRVLLIGLGDLHPQEDAVDGSYGHDDGNHGPEYGTNIPSIG